MSAKKNKQKTRGLTKKEITLLLVGAIVLIAVVACAVVLPDAIKDRRNHVVGVDTNGLVRGIQDNWLVTNISDSGTKKYSHLGNLSPAEGCAFKGADYLADPNERTLHFENSGAPVEEYQALVARGNYLDMANSTHENAGLLMTEVFSLGDVTESTVNGLSAACFTINGTIDNMYDADGNAIEPSHDEDGNVVYPQKYALTAYCYVASPMENRSVLFTATLFNEEENAFPEPETLVETLLGAAEGIEYL